MGNIKILKKETVNKISAGEVIERPASVVKELIENSLDAGADNITIEIKDGGKTLIRVSDNGSGMSKEDANLCIKPHATSKISDGSDLFDIKTLGFRGEALSSIAAVSRLVLKTSTANKGTQIEIEAGSIVSEKDIGFSRGTSIEVSELFFNTPARKKYLKSKDTEKAHIIDLITRYSFSKGDLSLKLISGGKALLVSPRTNNLLNKVVNIYGKDAAKNMVPLDYADEFCKIRGLIGKPYITRQDRSFQTLFVNGRHVKSDIVNKAISDAYHTLLFLDRHPVIILNISLDFKETDVNVHPTKDIIRIEKEDLLYKSIYSAIKDTFRKNNLIPEVTIEVSTESTTKQNYKINNARQTLLQPENTQKAIEKPLLQQQRRLGPSIVIGQLNRMYILAENNQGLLIIDQHAAQERVLFEKITKEIKEKSIKKQKLLKSIILELNHVEASKLENNIDHLRNIGFDIDPYGKNTFIVRQSPKLLAAMTKRDIIELVSEINSLDSTMSKINEEKCARSACRKSIKAGETLTMPQMQNILEELDNAENPFSCPHGRPTLISLPLADLEKKFLRKA